MLESEYYTVKDIQEIMQLSNGTVYNLVNSDGFPKIKIGRIIRIPKKEFEKWQKLYTNKKFVL